MRTATRLMQSYRPQGTVLGPPSPPPPPPSSLGPHLGDWMRQPGDQVLIVPDGNYDGLNIDQVASRHSVTGGKYSGWLVLQAQNRNGPVVDLSTSGFQLGDKNGGTQRDWRILFVGFKFVNGTTQVNNVSELRWWYNDFTFPAAEWKNQYVGAGGNLSNPISSSLRLQMPNWTCAGIRCISDLTAPYGNNIGMYGNYMHSLGDDGIFLQGYFNGSVFGNIIVDVYHHAWDPQDDTGHDLFHNDALQAEWGADWTLDYNHFGQNIQFEAYNSNLTNWTFGPHNWYAGSSENGFVYDTAPSGVQRDITGSSVGGQWWGMGQYKNSNDGFTANPTYNSNWDVFQLGFGNAPTGLTFNMTRQVPPTVTVTSGLITDLPLQDSARADPNNPANIWRAAHPYGSWETFFSGNWP